MTKYVVAPVAELAPGQRRVVTVKNRPIVVFNLNGDFFALLNRCPHQGADLSAGLASGLAMADEPGKVECSRPGEFLRCPWHGWEFDIRTGQSWCDPDSILVKTYRVEVADGASLVKGPYVAESFPVTVEDDYLILEA